MTHSYSKLLYHLVWSTKKREPYISTEIKNRLYGYIRVVINDHRQQLYVINGMPDHIHLLVSLSPTICISDFIKHVKVSSTKWMHSDLINNKNFAWQEGFAALTVGYSTKKSATKYIENQEKHHESISFEEEYLGFLKMQNIPFDPHFVLG